MKFKIPFGGIIEIRTSKPIDMISIGMDEEIQGLTFEIFLNGKEMPIYTKTKGQAIAFCLGAVLSANEINNVGINGLDKTR